MIKNADTTKIIVIGLVAMGGISTVGYYILYGMGLSPTIEPTISIITGLFSAIGVVTGVAVTKDKQRPMETPAESPDATEKEAKQDESVH